MKVFVTGASGFVGTRLVPELIAAGHEVVGLASDGNDVPYLASVNAEVHYGSIEDLDSLRSGAADADAVIHLAFNNDFVHLAENCGKDRIAIEAIGSALEGSDRPFLVTSFSGLGNTVPGQPALESNDCDINDPNPRIATEFGIAAVADRGVNVSTVRLPMVHDVYRQGIITAFIALARQKGSSAYVDDGDNCFPSAAVADVSHLYVLALERAVPRARYHAVAEAGVPYRSIAEIIGEGLDVPVVSLASGDAANEHFEHLAAFANRDLSASSAQTQAQLDWHPTGPSLLSDMRQLKF